jgi:peptidoglycan/xylan/chitin deacetylase (PgdA/CDA1 family)
MVKTDGEFSEGMTRLEDGPEELHGLMGRFSRFVVKVNRRWPWLKMIVVGGLVAGVASVGVAILVTRSGEVVPEFIAEQDLSGIELGSIMEWEPRISVHYPITKNETVNEAVYGFVEEKLARFREESQMAGEMNIVFDVHWYGKEMVGFRFVIYETGMRDVGEVNENVAMEFNLVSGERYALKDLWRVGEGKYLKALSDKVREEFAKMGEYGEGSDLRSAMMEVTGPVAENFSRFVIDGDKLVIYFQPYQVGVESVEIALAGLTGLNPEIFGASETDVADEEEAPVAATAPPVVNVDGVKGERLVALTFDDGPGPHTNRLLDILAGERVKVTFFVLGSRAQYYPDIVRRAASEGHQVASHTLSHKDLTKLSVEGVNYEIVATNEVLAGILGYGPTAMRPPYGAVNDVVRGAAGVPIILWSVDPLDWKYRDSDVVYNNVVGAVGDGSVVLMHDIHATTVGAVQRIIETLRGQGYAFVTIDEMFAARGVEGVAGSVYRGF